MADNDMVLAPRTHSRTFFFRSTLRRRLQARHTTCAMQVRVAGHASEFDDGLYLHLRGDRAWLGLGPAYPVRPRNTATFIVGTEETWAKFGFGDMSKEVSIDPARRSSRVILGRATASDVSPRPWSAGSISRLSCSNAGATTKPVTSMEHAAATGANFSIGFSAPALRWNRLGLSRLPQLPAELADAFAQYEDARPHEVLQLTSAVRHSHGIFRGSRAYLDLRPLV